MNIHIGIHNRILSLVDKFAISHNYKGKIITILAITLFVLGGSIALLKNLVLADASAVGDLTATLSFGNKYISSDITENNFEIPVGNGAFATIKIDAEFTQGRNKKIKVKVPTGIGIDSYSATETTAEMDGVTKLAIDNDYQKYVKTSSLTAATSDTHILDKDGNQVKYPAGTDWTAQLIPGYTSLNSSTQQDQRTYGGDIEWTFTNTTSKIELVLSVFVDNEVLTHLDDTEVLEDIVIIMESSAGSSEKHCGITGTELFNFDIGRAESKRIDNLSEANVLYYDTIEGKSERFGIGFYVSATKYDLLNYALMDKMEYSYTYPEGVYFDGRVGVGMVNKIVTSMHYEDDLLTVNVNEGENGGGTIDVVIRDLRITRNWGKEITAYFRADNTVYHRDNNVINGFKVDAKFYRNDQEKIASSLSYTRTLVYPGSKRDITVTGRNYTRRDINSEYPEYGYDQFIGGFRFVSALAYPNVKMKFEFTDKMGVRAVTVPGTNIRDVSATTTNGRMIEIESISGSSSKTAGVMINSQHFGLLDGEYLLTVVATVDLSLQGDYGSGNYNGNACSYYGVFLNGTTDTAVLSVIDEDGNIEINGRTNEPIIDSDTTRLGWTHVGVYSVNSETYDSDGNSKTVFYPNQKINVKSQILSGFRASHTDTTIIDPIVIISVPKGITLDTQSVTGESANGITSGAIIQLTPSTEPTTQIIDNVEWTTHYYKSENPLDLISVESSTIINKPYTSADIKINFDLIVGNSVPQYNLDLVDIISYDLGMPTVKSNGTSHNPAHKDEANRAGKGENYTLAAASNSIQTKPLVGLNVDIGIRTKGLGQDFMTYDGTEGTIATLSHRNDAEVEIFYESTGSSEYKAGSTIYIPVPKYNINFAKYFENMNTENPMEETENVTFEYSTNLASVPVLVGDDGATWTTYFSTDVIGSNSNDYTVGNGAWEPVESNTGAATWVKASDYNEEMSKITMIKFVANSVIEPGSTGSCVYELSIDNNSSRELSATNYWRSYNKTVTHEDNTGIWNYSSIIAANADGISLDGQIFVDLNNDASYGEDDEKYTSGLYSVLLTRNDGPELSRELVIDEDGHFINRAKTADGEMDFMLEPGSYTLTINRDEGEERYVYSDAESNSSSNSGRYYNDIKNTDIDADKIIAVKQFDIDLDYVGNDGYTYYIGIGLVDLEQPDEPEEPDEPDDPDNPDGPDNPDDPDEPDDPDSPDEPDNPENPDDPDEPDNPENPDNPTDPEITVPDTGDSTAGEKESEAIILPTAIVVLSMPMSIYVVKRHKRCSFIHNFGSK